MEATNKSTVRKSTRPENQAPPAYPRPYFREHHRGIMLADSRGVLIGDWVNLDNDPEWAELLGVADRWAVLRRAGGSVCIREVEEYVGLVELVEPRSSDDLGPLGLPAGSVDDVDRIYNLAMAFDNADCAVATAGCSLPTWPAFKLDLSREIVATCNRIWPRPFA